MAAVQLWADTTTAPALTEAEVGLIVDQHQVRDTSGVRPGEAGWVPTYWVSRAVAAAYDLRAARAALLTDVTTDGTSVTGSQVHAHLLAMARRFRAQPAPASARPRRGGV